MSRRVFWIVAALVIVVLLGALYRGRYLLLSKLGCWLDVGGRPQPSDYVMVFGGSEEVRPFVAAALVKAGYARKALVVKIDTSPDENARLMPPIHEVIRQVLIHRGVGPESVVLIDRPSVDTFGEADALGAFLRSAPHAQAIVVTTHFHTRRTRWAVRRVMGEMAGRVCFVSAPSDEFVLERWWENERGWERITSEYLKLAFYVLRYSPGRVAAVVGEVLVIATAIIYLWSRARSKRALADAAS